VSKVTLAAIAFLLFAIGVSAWLLTRKDARTVALEEGATVIDPRAGLTFAEWSVRSDGVLLAEIDPGTAGSTVPRRFLVVQVKRGDDGLIHVSDGQSYSWSADVRGASASALFALGFRVNTDGLAFNPPDDPLWSEPIPRVDGGIEQTVVLRSKTSSAHTSFTRKRSDPASLPYWNRRAIGFASPDGHMVYVTPDAIVIPSGESSAAP